MKEVLDLAVEVELDGHLEIHSDSDYSGLLCYDAKEWCHNNPVKKWNVCSQDEGKAMTWSNFYIEDKATKQYKRCEKKKARMLCENSEVVEKDGDEKMTEEMK